ncbi:MAG: CDP-alcohol phosphatidyltransferase family protein, partial [Actinomycetota bacterium]|nr:CDP-alcohol phosphatidyltransferase family protein [Actinomycetota bacterium]
MGLPHRDSRRPFSYKETFRQLIRPLARLLSAMRVGPDSLTAAGWVLSVVAAVLFALGYTKMAGAVMLFAGLFDALD